MGMQIGGNKVRKLDGMLPSLKEAGVTHVVRFFPYAMLSKARKLL